MEIKLDRDLSSQDIRAILVYLLKECWNENQIHDVSLWEIVTVFNTLIVNSKPTAIGREKAANVKEGIEQLLSGDSLLKILNEEDEAAIKWEKVEEASKVSDSNVNHPKHYNSHPSGVECIEVIRHMRHNPGACIKYLWRSGLKEANPEPQEIGKAIWYLADEFISIMLEKVPSITIQSEVLKMIEELKSISGTVAQRVKEEEF